MPADDSQQSQRRNGEPVIPGDDVILSEATAAPGREEPAPVIPLTPHDLATPYVLDALALDEREAYEEHLAGCAICQQRVAELEAVAGLLPDALVTPPADLPDAYPFLLRDVAHETLPFSSSMSGVSMPGIVEPEPLSPAEPVTSPVPDLPSNESPAARSGQLPPLDDVVDELGYDDTGEPEAIDEPDEFEVHGDQTAEPDQELPELIEPDTGDLPDGVYEDEGEQDDEPIVAPRARNRPPGRIRPGVRPAGGYAPAAEPVRTHSAGRSSPIFIAVALLGVIAIGLFLWALLLQGRVNDLEDEIDQQNTEIASLRQQANATAYTLSPTVDGPAGASGTFFFSLPDQRGALVARGLEAAPQGQAYQLWYIEDEGSVPIAGPTFQVDAGGEAVVPLTAEVSTFDAVAVSLEPADGSDAPTTPLLLQGRLGGAAG
jgi:hypothetical protein